jgi:hypothetical protein
MGLVSVALNIGFARNARNVGVIDLCWEFKKMAGALEALQTDDLTKAEPRSIEISTDSARPRKKNMRNLAGHFYPFHTTRLVSENGTASRHQS